jgi:hypothetical protein
MLDGLHFRMTMQLQTADFPFAGYFVQLRYLQLYANNNT